MPFARAGTTCFGLLRIILSEYQTDDWNPLVANKMVVRQLDAN